MTLLRAFRNTFEWFLKGFGEILEDFTKCFKGSGSTKLFFQGVVYWALLNVFEGLLKLCYKFFFKHDFQMAFQCFSSGFPTVFSLIVLAAFAFLSEGL